jgi:hypothetical protein
MSCVCRPRDQSSHWERVVPLCSAVGDHTGTQFTHGYAVHTRAASVADEFEIRIRVTHW